MTSLLVGAGSLAFRKALHVLNRKLADGDVTEQRMRAILMTDFDEIKESLNELRHKEFRAASPTALQRLRPLPNGEVCRAGIHKGQEQR